jgi:hypothetical protein
VEIPVTRNLEIPAEPRPRVEIPVTRNLEIPAEPGPRVEIPVTRNLRYPQDPDPGWKYPLPAFGDTRMRIRNPNFFLILKIKGVLCKSHIRCKIHGSAYNIRTGVLEDSVGLDSIWTFKVKLIKIKNNLIKINRFM